MVQVEDPRGRWSVSASEVIRIVNATDWVAAPAIDVLAALGALPWARNRRVLIMRGAHSREIALVAAGALAVAEVELHDVLPLPSALAAASPQVSAIVVAADASLSLLIEPSAVTSSGDTVVGEELCPSHS
jgi:chemotaxis signal transduction protein